MTHSARLAVVGWQQFILPVPLFRLPRVAFPPSFTYAVCMAILPHVLSLSEAMTWTFLMLLGRSYEILPDIYQARWRNPLWGTMLDFETIEPNTLSVIRRDDSSLEIPYITNFPNIGYKSWTPPPPAINSPLALQRLATLTVANSLQIVPNIDLLDSLLYFKTLGHTLYSELIGPGLKDHCIDVLVFWAKRQNHAHFDDPHPLLQHWAPVYPRKALAPPDYSQEQCRQPQSADSESSDGEPAGMEMVD